MSPPRTTGRRSPSTSSTPKHPARGEAQRGIHHSLTALAEALEAKGSRLILRRGKAETVLAESR
ncbi:deoxyribodipyrimidine photo-lyase [Sphingomonas sp. MMS24-JH45]